MSTIEPYKTKGRRLYRVRYRTPDNRQTCKRGFKTKREAEQFAASVEVQKYRGEFVDVSRSKALVGDLGEDWLGRKVNIKPSTRRTLESSWRVHVEPRWGRTPVARVEFTAVQSWIADLGDQGLSPTSIKRCLGVLSGVLEEARRDRRIMHNPCIGIATPRKTQSERVVLTHDQLNSLAAAAGSHQAFVLVLGYCGLRWGEAIGLRVKDIDFARNRLSIVQNAVEIDGQIQIGTPKTHDQRSVPFLPMLVPLLKAACKDKLPSALVFSSPDGGFMRRTRTDVGSGGWFAGAVKRSGVPRVTPRDLRHTAASLAISVGANAKAVQRMLGHKSAAMTLDTYSSLFDDDLDAVALALNAAGSSFLRPN